jgi:hypothetical protein
VARRCNVCKQENDASALYCTNCGAGLPFSRRTPKPKPEPPSPRRFRFTASVAPLDDHVSIVKVFRLGAGDQTIQFSWQVFVDGMRVGKLKNGQAGKIFVDPGEHSIRISTVELTITPKPRETVRVRGVSGSFDEPNLEVIDSSTNPSRTSLSTTTMSNGSPRS